MANLKADMVQVYVFRGHGRDREYLLLQRDSDDTLYPDLWQMVTGSIESDERATDAARRELQEETGIVAATEFVVVPYIASFYLAEDDSVHNVPVFAVEVPESTEISLSPEHQCYDWLPYEQAIRRLVFPGHKEGLRILHYAANLKHPNDYLTTL